MLTGLLFFLFIRDLIIFHLQPGSCHVAGATTALRHFSAVGEVMRRITDAGEEMREECEESVEEEKRALEVYKLEVLLIIESINLHAQRVEYYARCRLLNDVVQQSCSSVVGEFRRF